MAFEGSSAVKPQFITLPTDRKLAYTLAKVSTGASEQAKELFIVFVNGLGLPQASWHPAIGMIQQIAMKQDANISTSLTFLTYDRPGQGLSQPPNASPPEPHDILASVDDLQEMITKFRPSPQTPIILVSHSIGVPLARLYIGSHPNTISSLLAIDSNMANSDFVSMFPNPDSSDFEPDRDLPQDTTTEQLREALGKYRMMFHPSAPNGEKLDRTTLASHLPFANKPVLVGADDGKPIHLSVVGHDPNTFAEESLRISPRGLSERYLEPVWQKYNEELLNIGRAQPNKVLVAEGAGHFVQRDRPDYVAERVWEMITLLIGTSNS